MSLSRLRSQLEYNSSVSDLNMSLRKNTVVLSDSKVSYFIVLINKDCMYMHSDYELLN